MSFSLPDISTLNGLAPPGQFDVRKHEIKSSYAQAPNQVVHKTINNCDYGGVHMSPPTTTQLSDNAAVPPSISTVDTIDVGGSTGDSFRCSSSVDVSQFDSSFFGDTPEMTEMPQKRATANDHHISARKELKKLCVPNESPQESVVLDNVAEIDRNVLHDSTEDNQCIVFEEKEDDPKTCKMLGHRDALVRAFQAKGEERELF